MPKVFFFIGFLMAVTYSIPGTADMMDDLKNSQEMSSFLLEGKLEEAAEIFSHIKILKMSPFVTIKIFKCNRTCPLAEFLSRFNGTC